MKKISFSMFKFFLLLFSIVIAISTLMVELHILVHNLMISTDISTYHKEYKEHCIQRTNKT